MNAATSPRTVEKTPSSLLWRALGTFARDAPTWRVSRGTAIVVAAAPVVSAVLVVISMKSFSIFDWLTRENSLFQWLQFLALAAATVLFLWLGGRLVRGGRTGLAVAYLATGLATFFVAAEELSWGQVLFHWETDPLSRRSFQGEASFHTTAGGHGPAVYAFILIAMYGSLVPLLALVTGRTPRTSRSRLLIPPLFLVPAFFVPFSYRLVRTVFDPAEDLPRYAFQITMFAEFAELTLYFAVLVLAILAWRLERVPKEGA